MKKVFGYLFKIIIVLGIIAVTVLLGIKIVKDTKEIKVYNEESEIVNAEVNYFTDKISSSLRKIEDVIEKDIGQDVELADSGTITKIELYFVTKVDGKYKFIVDKNVDGVQKFEIAENELSDGKFYITPQDLGLENCIYSDIDKYSISKDGLVEYGK